MNKRYFANILLLGGMLAGGAACSGDNDPADVYDDGVKVRRMTITQTDGTAARNVLTRASLTEDDGLTASWTAGDRLTYCNLSRTNPSDDGVYTGLLTATSSSAISQFTGDVVCRQGDYLAVVYPAASFATNENYTISLTGQDGTLQTLAARHHYVYGVALVNSVTDQTANATMQKMKSLLTVCKFSFVDRATSTAIPIKTLVISYGGTGSDADTYPQTATVAIGANTAQADVHATDVAGSTPLAVTCPSAQDAVFVALLPTSGPRTFNFTVTDGSGNTYKGSAHATLTEGEYIVATGLKLTKNN